MKLRKVEGERAYLKVSTANVYIKGAVATQLRLRDGMGIVIAEAEGRFFCNFSEILEEGYYELKADDPGAAALHCSCSTSANKAGLSNGKWFLGDKVIDEESLVEYYELSKA